MFYLFLFTRISFSLLTGVTYGLVIDSSRVRPWPVHRQATTPMCLRHQAVQFGTGQRAVMLCGREGNGVCLASHWPCVTDFSGLSTYGLNGHATEREMCTPPTFFTGASSEHGLLYLFFTYTVI